MTSHEIGSLCLGEIIKGNSRTCDYQAAALTIWCKILGNTVLK